MEGLVKLAMASFDAQRNKQYWQLLKRLYGGSDEAVQSLQNTRDPGIYHGTKAENVPSILRSGMKSTGHHPHGQLYGEGHYFGERALAERYPKSNGELVRLKRPSELSGSRTLYPRPEKVMKVDNAVEEGTLEAQKVLSANARDRIIEESGPEAHDLWWTTKARFKPENKEKYKTLFRSIKDKDHQIREEFPMFSSDRPTSDGVKMRYFGKTKDNETVFDPIHQNSFLIQQKQIPPSLLTRGD